MSDNPATPVLDNPVTPEAPVAAAPVTSWKSGIRTDLRDSPLLQKFEDNPQGLEKALESHANLEKLLGNEKVPIPKDANDREGWARFNKAMGIPEKADGYGLSDVKFPDSMKGMSIDKGKFAEVVHANNLTPSQAQGLWKTYNDIQIAAYNSHMDGLQKNLEKTSNTLRAEWGDAYATNVELGQNVISQFAENQEQNDYLTSVLSSDPQGIKFLAKLGEQFAENKVGSFNVKRFSVTPDEAKGEIEKLKGDLNGPYFNGGKKFTPAEQEEAIKRVNDLQAVITRAKG